MKKIKLKKREELKPFNAVVQVCPDCGKVDAYKGDNHSCEYEAIRQQNQDHLLDYKK